MLKVFFDMEMPETCKDCPFHVVPCGDCMVDAPQFRSAYPYCNEHWSSDDMDKYNRFLDKPDWCPLKEVE